MSQRPVRTKILVFALLIAGFLARPSVTALAQPPVWPSSFYGTVTRGGANVPDGTPITAWGNGGQYEQTLTFTHEDASVYVIEVPADDAATPEKDGCLEGDALEFRVDGVAANEAGVCHPGTNQELNLTVDVEPPSIVSVVPSVGDADTSIAVALTGSNTNFAAGSTTVSFGAGISVVGVTVNSPTQAVVDITIASDASPGYRDVTATTGAEIAPITNGFQVRSASIDVWLPGQITAPAGAHVTVPVTVPVDLTGLDILAYEFDVAFDPAILQVEGVGSTGTLSADWNVTENHGTLGLLEVAALHTEPLAGSGVLLDLLFTVVGNIDDSSAIDFSDFIFNEGSPGAVLHDGALTVQSSVISGAVTYATTMRPMENVLMTLSGEADDTVLADASGLYEFVIAASGNYTVTPSTSADDNGAITAFDASQVARCVVNLLPASSCPLPSSDVSLDGQVRAFDGALIARYVVDLHDPPSNAGSWVFSPSERTYAPVEGNQVDQDFTAYLAGDVTGNWEPTMLAVDADTVVTVEMANPSLSANGNRLSAGVRAEDVQSAGVYGYQLVIDFDPAALQFEQVIQDGTLSKDWTVVHKVSKPGRLRIAAYGTEPLSGDRDLLGIDFRTLSSGSESARVRLTQALFNEGNPRANVVDPSQERIFLPYSVR